MALFEIHFHHGALNFPDERPGAFETPRICFGLTSFTSVLGASILHFLDSRFTYCYIKHSRAHDRFLCSLSPFHTENTFFPSAVQSRLFMKYKSFAWTLVLHTFFRSTSSVYTGTHFQLFLSLFLFINSHAYFPSATSSPFTIYSTGIYFSICLER